MAQTASQLHMPPPTMTHNQWLCIIISEVFPDLTEGILNTSFCQNNETQSERTYYNPHYAVSLTYHNHTTTTP